jgi:hypothetical protein
MATRTIPTVDARRLRALAEWADGHRDRPYVLVERAGSLMIVDSDAVTPDDRELAAVQTSTRARNRPRPESVSLTAGKSSGPLEMGLKYDALFWTESSIEKFLLPYYYTARVLTEESLQELKQEYVRENVVAMAHRPPSVPSLVTVDSALEAVVYFTAASSLEIDEEPPTLRDLLKRG